MPACTFSTRYVSLLSNLHSFQSQESRRIYLFITIESNRHSIGPPFKDVRLHFIFNLYFSHFLPFLTILKLSTMACKSTIYLHLKQHLLMIFPLWRSLYTHRFSDNPRILHNIYIRPFHFLNNSSRGINCSSLFFIICIYPLNSVLSKTRVTTKNVLLWGIMSFCLIRNKKTL